MTSSPKQAISAWLVDVSQREFVRQCARADGVIFTGRYENLLRVRADIPEAIPLFGFGPGPNPIVVGPAADLDKAANDVTAARFFNGGQDCLCPDLVSVHLSVVDSQPTIDRHTRMWAQRRGLDVDMVMRVSQGRRDSEFIAMLVPGDEVTTETAWLHRVSCDDVAGITAMPGAADLLNRLPPNSWALVTSAAKEVAHRRLWAAGLPQPRLLVAAEHVDIGKPHPSGFLYAAANLGVTPSDCVVFEDSAAGMTAAINANMPLVAVGQSSHTAAVAHVPDLRYVQAVGRSHATRLIFRHHAATSKSNDS